MTENYPSYSEGSSAAGSGGGPSSSGAKEQARQAAGTAAEESRHVAGVAQGEAAKVASEARSQVSGLVSQASSQVVDQSRTQLGRLAEVLVSFADDVEQMAGQGSGPAAGLAQEAADRTRGVASALQGREPGEVLEDVRSFARRRPGVFLGGALVAGVLAGRLTRGAKAAQDGSAGSYGSSGSRSGGAGYAGTATYPTGAPTGPDGFAYQSGGTDTDPYVDRGDLPNPATSVSGGATYGDVPGGRA